MTTDNWKRIQLSDEHRVGGDMNTPSLKIQRLRKELLVHEQNFMVKYQYIVEDTMNHVLTEWQVAKINKKKKCWLRIAKWFGTIILVSITGFLIWYYWPALFLVVEWNLWLIGRAAI